MLARQRKRERLAQRGHLVAFAAGRRDDRGVGVGPGPSREGRAAGQEGRGEETARLGLMLGRLADVLDRTVRSTIQRMIGIITPAITVFMGAIVATVIASIMSAILGFNDLALSP